MKKETLKKMREKTPADIVKEIQSQKDSLWQLRVDLASGKVKNVRQIRAIKKTIAVLNTLSGENKLNQ
ncbi:MAG: 50S ribosomal protein L29 [Candidatus Harrisonbacteria bacterium RIFCSPLOWO2_02_FULL_45_10c]|uniref:Large ribosomal subunit protein uL29 n=1 Tax=Candidatus Harrisonbacteria bacterium RIFCSPLOWO2_02_FULL_45_10c TaxID=1798410 RepID=A0A1G1ZUG2_9BACT|nr:MAG: 50S ribosomal protein L29 [Candidatus Harrisonbacteria bacterium RIFCSPLOWO2_02_FULL_45_10c]